MNRKNGDERIVSAGRSRAGVFLRAFRRVVSTRTAFALAAPAFAAACQPSNDASASGTASSTTSATSATNTASTTTNATTNATSGAANAATATAASSGSAGGDDNADTSAGKEGDDPSLPPPAAAATSGAAKNTPAALVAEADRELHAMRSSSYEHHTSIDEGAGRFDFDCSGFVGYALEGADPAAWAELHATASRPLAKDFEGFFASIPPNTTRGHWMHVARISDLRPGDIIAWLQPADSTSKNTGHVLVVHGAVSPENDEPGTFYVPIVDSTALKHGAKDSRADSNSTGLGTGTILLVGDAAGAPVAFRWSSGKKSRVRETSIALGRVVP